MTNDRTEEDDSHFRREGSDMKVSKVSRWLTVVALATVLFAGATHAVELPFSEPDFDWIATGGSATPYHIWTTGDYWRQNFASTGLPSADAMTLSLNVDDTASETLNLDVLINAVDVGDFSLNPNDFGLQVFGFSFSPVAGDSYFIELVALNTITGGAGSYSISLDRGESKAVLTGSEVPEPTTLVMLALAGAGLALRKRVLG